MVRADPLERAGDRNGEDRRVGLLGRLEDRRDPLVGQAGPGGVVNADEIDVGLHAGQGLGDRIGPLRAALDHVDAQDGHVGGELELEVLAVLGRDDHDHLLDVVAVEELFGRVQPDRLVRQRRERLLVVLVVKPAALARRRQDDGKIRHELLLPDVNACAKLIVGFRQGASSAHRHGVRAAPIRDHAYFLATASCQVYIV